jgi:hypothetical protein
LLQLNSTHQFLKSITSSIHPQEQRPKIKGDTALEKLHLLVALVTHTVRRIFNIYSAGRQQRGTKQKHTTTYNQSQEKEEQQDASDDSER